MNYHINPESGRPNKCSANPSNPKSTGCKYSKNGIEPAHYETFHEAASGYAETMSHEEIPQTQVKNPTLTHYESIEDSTKKSINDLLQTPLASTQANYYEHLTHALKGEVMRNNGAREREALSAYTMRKHLVKASNSLPKRDKKNRAQLIKLIKDLENTVELTQDSKFQTEQTLVKSQKPHDAELRIDKTTKEPYIELYNGVNIKPASEFAETPGGTHFKVANLHGETLETSDKLEDLIKRYNDVPY